jgi:hypothetical protein
MPGARAMVFGGHRSRTDWEAFARDRWQRGDTLDPVGRLLAPLGISWARAAIRTRDRRRARHRAYEAQRIARREAA